MNPDILSPHVFSYVLSLKFQRTESLPLVQSEEDDETLVPSREKRRVLPNDAMMDMRLLELISSIYRGHGPQSTISDGEILVDTAAEYLRKRYDSVYAEDLRCMRLHTLFTLLNVFWDLGIGELSEDLTREGYTIEKFNGMDNDLIYRGHGLDDFVGDVSSLSRFLAEGIEGHRWEASLEGMEYAEDLIEALSDEAGRIDYFVHKLRGERDSHRLQEGLDMRQAFVAIREAYDLYHRHSDKHGGDLIDPTTTRMHDRLRIVRPEIVQQRVEWMGKEIDFMFAE